MSLGGYRCRRRLRRLRLSGTRGCGKCQQCRNKPGLHVSPLFESDLVCVQVAAPANTHRHQSQAPALRAVPRRIAAPMPAPRPALPERAPISAPPAAPRAAPESGPGVTAWQRSTVARRRWRVTPGRVILRISRISQGGQCGSEPARHAEKTQSNHAVTGSLLNSIGAYTAARLKGQSPNSAAQRTVKALPNCRPLQRRRRLRAMPPIA